jgi:DNA polymerase-3 subunit delta'
MSEPVARFANIRGHERTRDLLRAAVEQGRLPHALLFAGPEGVGKRTVALALAAWLQCEHRDGDACGHCASCGQTAAGSHPDVRLVTVAAGKKEIGVDRAREVKRFVQLQPVRGIAKVAIVDEAHRLTVAAQNALLKTLEEPPDRSLLILVANNPDALLGTVRSRCQRVQFPPLPAATVAAMLSAGYGLDATTAHELAVLADGSPGRALALSRSDVAARRADLLRQLAGLKTARYVEVVQLANELSQPEGHVDVKLELLLSHYRDDAVRAVGAAHLAPGADATVVPSSDTLRAALRRVDSVQAAWGALHRSNPNRQLLLEALLLRLAGTG